MCSARPGKECIGVGGGALIVNDAGDVLLARRTKNTRNDAGQWSKPGGTVEYGEKVADAIVREIKEELNIDIVMTGYLPHVDHFLSEEQQHWVAFNYIARIVGGEVTNMEPEKCDAVAWFPCEQLPENSTQTTRESIAHYLAGRYITL